MEVSSRWNVGSRTLAVLIAAPKCRKEKKWMRGKDLREEGALRVSPRREQGLKSFLIFHQFSSGQFLCERAGSRKRKWESGREKEGEREREGRRKLVRTARPRVKGQKNIFWFQFARALAMRFSLCVCECVQVCACICLFVCVHASYMYVNVQCTRTPTNIINMYVCEMENQKSKVWKTEKKLKRKNLEN